MNKIEQVYGLGLFWCVCVWGGGGGLGPGVNGHMGPNCGQTY